MKDFLIPIQNATKTRDFFTNISVQIVNISVSGAAALPDKIPPWLVEGLLHIRISGWASDSNLHLLSLIMGICIY